MIRKSLRLIIASLIFIGAIFLFVFGYIWWGILAILITGLVTLTHFRNESIMTAFYYLRKNDIKNAEKALGRLKHPEYLIKSQEAYYYFLFGLVESQLRSITKAEKYFKKALNTGLRMKNDQAVAYLNLSGIYLSQRNKKVATHYLSEAKKLDKAKLLSDQVKEIEAMLKRI